MTTFKAASRPAGEPSLIRGAHSNATLCIISIARAHRASISLHCVRARAFLCFPRSFVGPFTSGRAIYVCICVYYIYACDYVYVCSHFRAQADVKGFLRNDFGRADCARLRKVRSAVVGVHGLYTYIVRRAKVAMKVPFSKIEERTERCELRFHLRKRVWFRDLVLGVEQEAFFDIWIIKWSSRWEICEIDRYSWRALSRSWLIFAFNSVKYVDWQ